MMTLGLCPLELRNIVEAAFLPLKCTCTEAPDQSLTVQVDDPSSGKVDLLVTGISTDRLCSSQAISALVAELREEIRRNHAGLPHARLG